jgi:hypothetical protein
MINEAELRRMSQDERRQLAYVLAALDKPHPLTDPRIRRRMRFGLLLVTGVLYRPGRVDWPSGPTTIHRVSTMTAGPIAGWTVMPAFARGPKRGGGWRTAGSGAQDPFAGCGRGHRGCS